MPLVQFYHLTATPFERALPRLVEKAYQAGLRAHVVLGSEAQLAQINQALWTFAQDAFLPHGTADEPNPEAQPVFLSTTLEAPNQPSVVFITEGSAVPAPERYARILDVFDGNNAEAVASARTRWADYKTAGCELAYFKQNTAGVWEKAA